MKTNRDNLHIIAEAGTNHGGKLETAKSLVDIAVDAKADSVKFQMIYPEGLYISKLLKDGELQENEVLEIRRKGMLSDDEYRELAKYCREKSMPMSASVFDRQGLDLLSELDPPYIKLASCDLNNYPLISQASELGTRLIISTGMASLMEVERAVDTAVKHGVGELVILHCVSSYPAPLSIMNLNMIDVLRTAFGMPVGLSDHTESSIAAAIAISKGATWVEKHYTYDRGAEGFDHVYAMEPEPMKQYIADLRATQEALQAPLPRHRSEQEASVMPRARRGLYAARPLEPGQEITADDVLIVRPQNSMTPGDLDSVVGRKLTEAVAQYFPLDWELFR
ncbi:N,N'-diacetyllegionaminic acid synthase [Bremerella volcania]|uniref:N,N'-diacetyllegionaminic acid synthase n=1 Tax=Bremerella volcania TaxID=2527984 RepID=A0A518C342_9BACT|nr:N-acetylneuraminate synthase family protein [Bremerella volcania]QDU73647.1 N,N'-diacetyllegionaminic acid synthase [Bremerella volcania]